MAKNNYLIGIDVGTGSARAGIFDREGAMVSSAFHAIQIWRPQPDFVEQSSGDIWKAICKSVNEAVQQASIEPDDVKGIGFDATCSLVVLGENDAPLSVTPNSDANQNIIVWMDHRAKREADEINQTGHGVLKYVGGVISPEMQTPKLLWVKRNHPDTWDKAVKFMDLPDFLVYKATGVDVRSVCTTTCKWTYLGHENSSSKESVGRWDDSYFREIGLSDLTEEDYKKIGSTVCPIGEPVGNGLSESSANEMGLKPGTPVGIAIIDAHAGGLGLLGVSDNGEEESRAIENRIALIGGTSSCHMAVSEDPVFIDGVWGPYFSAMIPGLWLNEGGQSATGALIDHIIFSSHHAEELKEKAKEKGTTVYSLLIKRLGKLAKKEDLDDIGLLTKDLHVLPYFHGNRSPRANPSLRGAVTGLTLSSTLNDLARLYLATIQSIAYGTRHIIQTMNEAGYDINQIVATGGGTKNEIFLQQHADICGCEILLPKEPEAVLLGSAILGAYAGGIYSTVQQAMINMNKAGMVINPKKGRMTEYHNAKYKVFHRMYEDEIEYGEMMGGGLSAINR